MKILALVSVCYTETSNDRRGFIQPPLHSQGGTPTSVGGFSFSIFALIGAFQPKEVATNIVGLILYHSKIVFQSLFQQKENLS
jgi:hypothetical protein